jgi:membrane-bound ClpP family serine protease
LALAARLRKAVMGEAAMVDSLGVAQTDIAASGTVLIRGEIWAARAAGKIPAGARVRVRQIDGLTLVVESAAESR